MQEHHKPTISVCPTVKHLYSVWLMAIRKLPSRPCRFRANPPSRVAEFHDIGTNLRVDFTLPDGSDSITDTP
jgi:hypothetical protein